MNIVLLTGRLVRDPHFNNGTLKFTLAIDRPRDKDGNTSADFPSVTVFGRQAESGSKYLHKGRMVEIQGSIRTGSYTDHDGKTVYTQEVIASVVKYLDSPQQSQQQQPQAQPRPQQPIQPPEPEQLEYSDDDVPF